MNDLEKRTASLCRRLAEMGILAIPAAPSGMQRFHLYAMEPASARSLALHYDQDEFESTNTRLITLFESESGDNEVWRSEEAEVLVRTSHPASAPGLLSALPSRTSVQQHGAEHLSVEGYWDNVGADRILLTRCPLAADITSRAWRSA
ncbi:hypothetical protein [Pseudomonas abietaniphila]|uniref:hypothetical protein n=1 Tax=Pseudomonas abietaniphila TaxID=89065 RepID=UPI00115FCB96|nr:hypothetical protein [Pseudomonas abietaniphila]